MSVTTEEEAKDIEAFVTFLKSLDGGEFALECHRQLQRVVGSIQDSEKKGAKASLKLDIDVKRIEAGVLTVSTKVTPKLCPPEARGQVFFATRNNLLSQHHPDQQALLEQEARRVPGPSAPGEVVEGDFTEDREPVRRV